MTVKFAEAKDATPFTDAVASRPARTPVLLLYVKPVEDVTLNAALALVLVKYSLVDPSPMSSVSSVKEAPNASELLLIVTLEFDNLALAILPANIAFVTPNAFTLAVSAFISIELSSTFKDNEFPVLLRPSPALICPAPENCSKLIAVVPSVTAPSVDST